MELVAEQIVGRTAELGALEQALSDLARRRAGAVEVVGDPGIGKTRLLAGRALAATGEADRAVAELTRAAAAFEACGAPARRGRARARQEATSCRSSLDLAGASTCTSVPRSTSRWLGSATRRSRRIV